MWVFGYGSLMWDGWEAEWGCLRRVLAELQGYYARSFNKRSVRNWGTKLCPGPTLNLIPSVSTCRGIAFEFPQTRRADILAYLKEREGKNFTLNERRIVLDNGTAVTALVPLYQRHNVIEKVSASEIAAMALRAHGAKGSCVHYVMSVAEHLEQLGIDDPAVTDICLALKAASVDPPT